MMGAVGGISTHVLDTAAGRPAAGVAVYLEREGPSGWELVNEGVTDGDGRLPGLLPDGVELVAGRYRISFDSGGYFASSGVRGFYPEVAIVFEVNEPGEHQHVPLLLSPFGYSTYRGS
jgi:5-hydroxyisourate hydrolase